MAYRPRTSAQNQRRQSKSITGFTRLIASTITGAARASAEQIAKTGLETLVNKTASFSDYTGVLINSYQAGIIRRGKWRIDKGLTDFVMSGAVSTDSRKISTSSFGSTDKNGKKTMHLLTSYGIPGTSKISFASPYRIGKNGKTKRDLNVFEIRSGKRRNPLSKQYRKRRYKGSNSYDGFGTSGVRKFVTFSGGVKEGYNILFDNGAPYAWNVQLNNKGSWVFPKNAPGGSYAFRIIKRNIETAAKYARKHR